MVAKLKKRRNTIATFRTLYGLGQVTSKKIAGVLGLDPRARKLTGENEYYLEGILSSLTIDYKLRAIVFCRIFMLLKHNTYRGLRHAFQLPTRGQRTHANGKTQSRLVAAAKWLPFAPTRYASKSVTEYNKNKNKNKNKGKTKKMFVPPAPKLSRRNKNQ